MTRWFFSAGAVGQSRIAIGESCVLIGGDDGTVTRASFRKPKWEAEFLGREAGKIRGMAVADVDAGVPGPELYATGYARNVI